MIQHVYERVCRARRLTDVIVATDDHRIFETVVSFGGRVWMTSSEHNSGTDRVAEVALQLDAEIVVNVQGDEPLIDPACIDTAVEPLLIDSELLIGSLKTASNAEEELYNPNVVKVVTDRNDFALYFSRSPLPYFRYGFRPSEKRPCVFFKHVGLYVYRKKFLGLLKTLKESTLEKTEALEQLRFLENGYRIKVVRYDYQSLAVDTPEDLERVQEYFRKEMPQR
jgi:3-deoxy-manno-octulosonate cytidylyltransferase (CMP-KDO synthetase)